MPKRYAGLPGQSDFSDRIDLSSFLPAELLEDAERLSHEAIAKFDAFQKSSPTVRLHSELVTVCHRLFARPDTFTVARSARSKSAAKEGDLSDVATIIQYSKFNENIRFIKGTYHQLTRDLEAECQGGQKTAKQTNIFNIKLLGVKEKSGPAINASTLRGAIPGRQGERC